MKRLVWFVAMVLLGIPAAAREYQSTSATTQRMTITMTVPKMDYIGVPNSRITLKVQIWQFTGLMVNNVQWYLGELDSPPSGWIVQGVKYNPSNLDPEYDPVTDTWTKIIEGSHDISAYEPGDGSAELRADGIITIRGYGNWARTSTLMVDLVSDTIPPNTLITSPPAGEHDPDITFEFIGFDNFAATTDLRYAWRLDPLEPDFNGWHYDTEKTYTNLPEGEYTFYVKAMDEVGKQDATPAHLTVMVGDYTPPENPMSFIATALSACEILLSWANPVNGDFAGVVIFRRTGTEPMYVPIRGGMYISGQMYDGCLCVYSGADEEHLDSDLLTSTTYYYKAFSCDTNGNYSEGTMDYATTLAAEAPTVVSTCPQDGAQYVSRNTVVTVEFSEPMDEMATEAAFSIQPAADGTFLWPDESILVFTPKQKLQPGGDYTVVISTDACSKAALHLADAYYFSFSVRRNEGAGNIREVVPDCGCGAGASIALVCLLALACGRGVGKSQ